MVTKTFICLAIYLVPFAAIIAFAPASVAVVVGLLLVMGTGKAFIGTAVMHDGLHGAYSRKKWVNSLIGFSAYIIGASPKIWKLQHNVLHHTYTNIEHADEDIAPRFVLRFSPNQPQLWFHRYQHLYAPLLYGISVPVWVTFKDIGKTIGYHKKGLIGSNAQFAALLLEVIIQKAAYITLFWALPVMVLPFSTGLSLALVIGMEFFAGILLSMIFQPAHVMPETHYVMQEEEQLEEDWAIHQLLTTTNFGVNSKLLHWCFGGLNFQVEHHLFPNICHVHYPAIAKIVKQTAAEYSIPYYEKPSLAAAVADHFKMMKALGRGELPQVKKVEQPLQVA